MKVFEVNNTGKLVALSAVKNGKLVKRAQIDDDEWEEIDLKWATELDADFENKTLTVNIRVFPKKHWIGIENFNEEGISDIDIIQEIVGESIKEEYPDFDVSEINIDILENEGSSIDDTSFEPIAEEQSRERVEDNDDDLQQKIDKSIDEEFEMGPSISSPSTAPRVQSPGAQAPAFSPGVSRNKPSQGVGEGVRDTTK